MKTTVEALKDYYAEIGGTSTDVENVVTIPDMIDAITALGGGSSLPDVTAEDNGDVLTVVEGEWTKSAPQSPFKIVNASMATNTITFENETQKSICETIKNGQLVVISTVNNGISSNNTSGCIYYIADAHKTSSGLLITFNSIYRTESRSNTTICRMFTISESNSTNTASVSTYSSDDYSSGGPT